MIKPPTTLNVANTVSGRTTSNDFRTLTKGAHKNQPRAHTVDENISIFLRSAATNSAVHAVRTHIPIEEAIFMAKVGAISNATTWYLCTVCERRKGGEEIFYLV